MFQLEKNPLLFRKLGVFLGKKVAPIFIIWKKSCSDFYYFFLICSLDKRNLLKFGKFWIRNVPIGKKSTFVPKWGVFRGKKVAPIFIIFFLICSLDKINLLKFGKFWIRNVPIGKKSTFVPKIEDFLRAKKFSDFFFIF